MGAKSPSLSKGAEPILRVRALVVHDVHGHSSLVLAQHFAPHMQTSRKDCWGKRQGRSGRNGSVASASGASSVGNRLTVAGGYSGSAVSARAQLRAFLVGVADKRRWEVLRTVGRRKSPTTRPRVPPLSFRSATMRPSSRAGSMSGSTRAHASCDATSKKDMARVVIVQHVTTLQTSAAKAAC